MFCIRRNNCFLPTGRVEETPTAFVGRKFYFRHSAHREYRKSIYAANIESLQTISPYEFLGCQYTSPFALSSLITFNFIRQDARNYIKLYKKHPANLKKNHVQQSKNISAAQIRDDVERRRAEAELQAANERQEQAAELERLNLGHGQGQGQGQSQSSNQSRARWRSTRLSGAAADIDDEGAESIAGPSRATAGPSSSSTRSRRNGKMKAETVGVDDNGIDVDMDVEMDDEHEHEAQSSTKVKTNKGKGKAVPNGKIKGKGKWPGKGMGKGKGKGKKRGSDDDDDQEDGEDDDYIDNAFGRDMYRKAPPAPGQFDNCEQCSKRFTVTPYSKTGPEGGLLCASCGKLQKDANNKANRASAAGRKPGGTSAGRKRRKIESDRMDGKIHLGARSLQQLCIEKVVAHHNDIEEFGDMPGAILERLSMIFSKNRVLGSKTLPLFLRPDLDTVAIHDAACKFFCH